MQILPPKRKPIYHDKHYKFRFLLKNPDFQVEINNLKDRFRRFNCPIPHNGFRSYVEYEKWNQKYWKMFSEYSSGKRDVSKLLKDFWTKLADENNRLNSENFDSFIDLREDIFPPVYGESIRQIAGKFGYNLNNREMGDLIFSYLFFNRQIPTETPFSVTHRRNPKTDKFELFIKIEPWTTRDDLSENWDFIEQEKSYYSGNRLRNNKWLNFEKDTDIYIAYEKAKILKDHENIKESLPNIVIRLIGDKYSRLTVENIKRTYLNTKKRLHL